MRSFAAAFKAVLIINFYSISAIDHSSGIRSAYNSLALSRRDVTRDRWTSRFCCHCGMCKCLIFRECSAPRVVKLRSIIQRNTALRKLHSISTNFPLSTLESGIRSAVVSVPLPLVQHFSGYREDHKSTRTASASWTGSAHAPES